MKVLGVSGSAIKNSNTDRALQLALESTGLETELIKLKDYTVSPCQACLGCVKTNLCVIDDDGIELAEKVKSADAARVDGNVPCIKCGQDKECKISGLDMLYGKDTTPESVGVNIFEEQPQAVEDVKALGQKIGQMLRDKDS